MSKKQRACTTASLEMKIQGGSTFEYPLGPSQVKYTMTRLGLSRGRIKRELTRLFRYGKTIRTHRVQIKPVFLNENKTS